MVRRDVDAQTIEIVVCRVFGRVGGADLSIMPYTVRRSAVIFQDIDLEQ